MLDFGMRGDNVVLRFLCGGGVGSVLAHVSLSVAVEQGRWFLISAGVSPGMVVSSSLRLSALRSVADGGKHMNWWM